MLLFRLKRRMISPMKPASSAGAVWVLRFVMQSYRIFSFASILLSFSLAVPALSAIDDPKTINTSKTAAAPAVKNALPAELEGHPPVTKQTRLELIRTLQAEFGFGKRLIPKGEKGLEVTSNGQVSPDDQSLAMQAATYGPAAKPGEKLQITDVIIKGSEIVFELNGGSKKKGH